MAINARLLDMDKTKTRAYYSNLRKDQVCDCESCRNFIVQFGLRYPLAASWLGSIGVDVAKPLETMPLCQDAEGFMLYDGPQYVVIGDADDFEAMQLEGLLVRVAASHPVVDTKEKHFVIEMLSVNENGPGPIRLGWKMDQAL